MEKIVRKLSEALFGLNYLGVLCGGAFTFVHASEKKQKVFKQTAFAHCCFLVNNYLLTYMKFRAFPHHLTIQLINDAGCMLTCFPTYSLWAYHDLTGYFNPPKINIIDQI